MNKIAFRVALAKRNLSQRMLAKLAEVDESSLSSYVLGKQSPSRETIKRISNAAGFNPEEVWSIFFTDELA